MKRKDRAVWKDWSYPILLILFGCFYMVLFGFPLPGDRSQAEEPPLLSQIMGLGEDGSKQPEDIIQGTDGDGQKTEGSPEENGGDFSGGIPEQEESDIGMQTDPAEENEAEVVYRTVEDDYFADAVFIGDSRTVGMYEYGGLEEISTFCCSTGLTVYKMFDAKIVKVPGQKEKLSVEDVLSGRQFSAVYLMIGINEMGTGTVDSFIEAYRACVEHLRELQPDAVIYLQGIIRVTSERSAQGDYISNEGIDARNEEIAKLADNESIFYLDVNPLICDETGGMVESYTYDGVHLKAKYISIWKEYLMSHAVQREVRRDSAAEVMQQVMQQVMQRAQVLIDDSYLN